MQKHGCFVFSGVVALLLMVGCSHAPLGSRTSDSASSESRPNPSVEQSFNQSEKEAFKVPSRKLTVLGVKLQNTDFDYPVTVNDTVEEWVDYFTGRGRKYYEKYLERSEYFIPFIEPILKQNGMPSDLVYLAMIESGFNNHARSWAKAVGPWQFMPATGKRYGLKVNWWVDERRDIEKSTLAAVGYLKDLYAMFHSWELAAAGYNAGESKVVRAIKKYKTTDFWQIYTKKFLKPETRNYVPKIIAAAIISKNRTQFGFPATYRKNLTALEEATYSSNDENEELENDETSPAQWGVPPPVTAEDEKEATSTVANKNSVPSVSKTGELSFEQVMEFEVQSPADFQKVASAAGLTYAQIKALNPEVLRWVTPPFSKTYRIKLPSSVKDKFLSTYNHSEFPKAVKWRAHVVHKGESLAGIAKQYQLKTDPLEQMNGVSARSRLKAGSTVLLPMPDDRSRTYAQLDLYDPPSKGRVRRRRGRSRARSSVARRKRRTSGVYHVTFKDKKASRAVTGHGKI